MQGSLGLELAREHRPDLILLDLKLPDLSGAYSGSARTPSCGTSRW